MLASMGSTIQTLAGSISLQTVAAKAASVATKVWSGIQLVFNAILTANPLGMIIVIYKPQNDLKKYLISFYGL